MTQIDKFAPPGGTLLGLAALAALGLLSLAAAPPVAAETTISFGQPQDISGDSDVSTAGSLVFAYGLGSSYSETVNGVPFSSNLYPLAPHYSVSSSGQVFGTFGGQRYAVNAAPFSGLSASYQQLLGGGIYTTGGPLMFTLSGLTAGDTYQLQYFVNDSRGAFGPERSVTLSADGATAPALSYNTAGDDGGLGQYLLGTFVADASGAESFTATGASSASNVSTVANALQLRDLGSPAPEPSQVGMMALMGLALGGLLLRARKRQTA